MSFNSLSGRFLGLMIVFVLIAEVLIFVPSVARYRQDYLQNRLELSQLAALALLATPEDAPVSPDLESELLRTAGVMNVVLRRNDVRELALSSEIPGTIARRYDLRAPMLAQMRAALAVFFARQPRYILVIGESQRGAPGEVEITLDEAPLKEAMIGFGLRILYTSLLLSLATAALLFFAVRWFIVRPINRVVDHMTAYQDDPEDAARIITPGEGARELRRAEIALHDLQVRLTGALRQKERLAALGGAVAKISHDLRNILTTTQILADRIEASPDPGVRRIAPKLVASLSRAITLCERTLTFGKAEEPAPDLATFELAPLVAEVVENERQATAETVVFSTDIVPGIRMRADADQLFRVLTNLARNAAQAIEATGRPGRVTITAHETDGRSEIRVADTGPGLPPRARENLFQPFRGGARQGGAGLGLVIAAELVRGHGGTLTLAETGPGGTAFVISLPAPADRRAAPKPASDLKRSG